MQIDTAHPIRGQKGICGNLPVFLGFAPASVLHAHSFTDILNEDTGLGYQRPRNIPHSKNFKHYIGQADTSTIALTLNLRGVAGDQWTIEDGETDQYLCTLHLAEGSRPFAQVDCQHRLGELVDSPVPLAFMAFIGLDLRSEMALFNIINTKAKGLSSSLTDYHESNLVENLAEDAPHLFIARRLNEDRESPWFRLIKYGGETSSGLKRRVSLRMMQRTIHRFLRATDDLCLGDVETKYRIFCSYWQAIRSVFHDEWNDPRHHLLVKGVGLYSLSYLLGDIVRCSSCEDIQTQSHFEILLAPLKKSVDWSSDGPFSTAGGQKGAVAVYRKLKELMSI